MEPKKRWDGYVSFSYLRPGIDHKEFELSPQIDLSHTGLGYSDEQIANAVGGNALRALRDVWV